MRKKIIHICQAPIGGTVEYLRLFLENIDKEKYENILICPSYGNMKKNLSDKVNKLYVLEMQREIEIVKDFKDILKLRKILKKEKADIIYLHSSKAGALGRIAAFGLKQKVIYNPHGWAFTIDYSEKKKKLYSLIERILYPLTDIIINISKNEYDEAIKYKLSSKKMVIIENGIDINRFKNNQKEKFLDKYVVGFVGRLSEQKNPLYLIELAEQLKYKIPNCLFYVVGDGELREELEKKIKQKELEKFFYLAGWCEKVEEEIKNFDIALMISKWEGFGLVVCEYMAAKKPVIAFPVGGVTNIIINNKNGIISNRDLRKKIILLYNDKKMQNKIKKEAYEQVKKNFNIKILIKKHEKIFNEMRQVKSENTSY
ncbi:MAG: glycosyltransferase family 4 protein [Cetobacterium sp.]|uniref:glycosyltransferase family 4 protein n=1 Tax=Cetobacterium sp. TaxID=2071632 RepID=UPI003EE481B3